MSRRAIRHHIVPQVLQRQFSIEGDTQRIWRTKRDKVSDSYRPLELKLIRKAFVINDHYTVLENDQRSDLIEKNFYGPLDDYLGRLLPQIIQTLEGGEVPSFSSEALNSLRQMVMHMAMRTPDFTNKYSDVELGRQLVEDFLEHDLVKNDNLYYRKFRAELNNTARLKERGRDIRVTATLNISTRTNEVLSKFVPRWAISQTRHSYILASRIVYRIGNGGSNGLMNPSMEMWMPITPKIALVLLRDPKRRIPHIVRDNPNHIRQINEYAVKYSFEVASHSRELLKSLTKQ